MKIEVAVPGSPTPNKLHGFCGHKAAMNQARQCRLVSVSWSRDR